MANPKLTPQLVAILRAIEERLTDLENAILARSAPAEEVRQALDDILKIYSITGQTGSVAIQQRDQIQALAEAMTAFHARLLDHDRRSGDEAAEIHGLMVQIRSLARRQVSQLDGLEQAAGMTAEERAAMRDTQSDQALQAIALLGEAADEARKEIKEAAQIAREVIKDAEQEASE
jgi:hypothetical protein